MTLQNKLKLHEDFWSGNGPCLIFVPSSEMVQYDVDDYESRFYDPVKMYEAESKRANPIIEWPTDGIPTVRPNFGTIFIPAIAGQTYKISDGQMPWPGDHLSLEEVEGIANIDIKGSKLLTLSEAFYEIHKSTSIESIAAYHPDTQGVYDILHLLRGNELFYEMITHSSKIKELLAIVTNLYIAVTMEIKRAMDEPANSMIHGHGTQQGLYFPHAGVRLSEDTDTLLSPAMIDEFAIPYMEKAATPFGGAFVHYCGKHDYLYEKIIECDFVKAIDLGNPEMYDTEWLLEKCSQTDTVFYGKLASEENETWQNYIERIAKLVKGTGSRCVLRPAVFPKSSEECKQMQDMWHEITV